MLVERRVLSTRVNACQLVRLHYAENWFHGQLAGRGVAEQLLSRHMHDHPGHPTSHHGLFLVRESSTFQDEFSLTLYGTKGGRVTITTRVGRHLP